MEEAARGGVGGMGGVRLCSYGGYMQFDLSASSPPPRLILKD